MKNENNYRNAQLSKINKTKNKNKKHTLRQNKKTNKQKQTNKNNKKKKKRKTVLIEFSCIVYCINLYMFFWWKINVCCCEQGFSFTAKRPKHAKHNITHTQ